ncbi:hypothetical protein PT043_09055, partial [Erysipelothrix rhusiopathiae]|nr:hypothetical protein [Erysipelothrix rhusiopathiae]
MRATFRSNAEINFDVEKVSEITKQALKENKSLKTLVLEQGLMSEAEVDEALKPESMI